MTNTTAQRPGDVVRRFYDLLGEGKIEELLDLVDDSAVIRESNALPFGGEYHGGSGMRELLGRIGQMTKTAELENVGGIEYFDTDGDQVIVRMGFRATNRTSGRTIDSHVAEIYTVSAGKVVDIDVYYRDPSALAEIVHG